MEIKGITNIVDLIARFLVKLSAAAIGLLLVSCSLASGSQEETAPVLSPFRDAPVTATIDGKVLVITNNTEKSIHYQIFPTEILPVIEWAPCIAPDNCPAEQKIDSGDEKRIAVKSIAGEETEYITVFWWTYLKKVPGASVPPLEMDEFVVPLP